MPDQSPPADPGPSTGPSAGRPARPPAPLLVAALVAALEGVVLVVAGVGELVATSADTATMGVSTSVFFLVYGAGLAWCAWRLRRRESWARAPVVLAQLIQLGVAWSFRGGSTTAVAAALAVLAVVVLVGIFHPRSLRALAD